MRDQYSARTHLHGVEQCRQCWNDRTDIVWFAAVIPESGSPVYADWSCRKYLPDGKCERGRLRYQERFTRQISSTAGFFLTCHEIGHASGFQHHSDGCMHGSGGLFPPPSDGVLSAHMISHINAQY